jgi:hypothetical protein
MLSNMSPGSSRRGIAIFVTAVLVFSALASLAPIVRAQGSTITINAGETQDETLGACANVESGSPGTGANVQAQASGDASAWVSPTYIDFGLIAYGSCSQQGYTISVPADTPAGDYSLVWTYTCQDNAGYPCSGSTDEITVTVNGTSSST